MRDNTKGVHAERWRHTHGCGRFFNALRDTTTDHLPRHLQGRRAAPGGAGTMNAALRTAAGGRIDRSRVLQFRFDGRPYSGVSRATRSPRRCSPTACTSSGRSFKYHRPRGILAAGAEEPNALVDGAPRCRALHTRTCAPRRSSCTRGCRPTARTAGRASRFDVGARQRLLLALHPGRLLLQDLHVAARRLALALRAAHPRRRGPRQGARAARSRIATPTASRIATCWWSAPVRPDSPRRWPPLQRRRARHPVRRAGASSAARCS